MTDQEYLYLRNKIFAATHLDINCYKMQQMRRRLEAYILKNGNLSIPAFCHQLEESPDRQKLLLDYLAINVSEFFRDLNQFNNLKNMVLPQFLAVNKSLNIWSAACSCGQEPYSIAMILEEITPGRPHRIVATDIDRSALTQANNGGPFLPLDVKNVPKSLLLKYFRQKDGTFWLDSQIKNKVVFKQLNLLSDVFEEKFDLIVCRNVIIYFSDVVRNNLYLKFNRSLKTGGVLFLGGSEVMLRPGDEGFNMLTPAFYRKLAESNKVDAGSRNLSEVLG
jgi:chemotaxis protein methyltransferase CheR